ncbi:5'/3'-nucleotidase SurE [Ekhidna sp. MALMAid0563]|uniref:5'/3'-nucleotidase SurE n=1 Tax=Ekhidna sp. MALMAid0563 TaxID=3143937 RepID=UPI0032DE9357
MAKPLILVSNDDGITSRGIRKLVNVVKELGEVVIVAPDSPQSGMGHAITVGDTLRLKKSELFEGIEAYECTGTPADCVKLAKHYVLKDRNIDLVVSGVNHGSNSSISVLYSGTMSAAIEGAIEHLPAIGFSLCDYDPDADMDHIDDYIKKVTEEALKNGIPKGIALNVNFPARQKEEIRGIKVCRQANANWEEQFDERKDPYGRAYFWMVGNFVNHDKGEDNDEWALANNYVSVVPCQFDMTGHHAISQINEEWDI